LRLEKKNDEVMDDKNGDGDTREVRYRRLLHNGAVSLAMFSDGYSAKIDAQRNRYAVVFQHLQTNVTFASICDDVDNKLFGQIADDDDDDDHDESMKSVFARSYSLETVTSVLMKIRFSKQFSF